MNNEICTISIGNGWLDDDYTFYEDGRIKRFYDQSSSNYNITIWTTSQNISETRKRKIIQNCPEDKKQIIAEILNL